MHTLRDYQRRAILELYYWLEHHDGHPVLVLPTGAGKSFCVAHLCQDTIKQWPDTKILMLTGRKELIEQNYEKLRAVWPNAPVGIYSAAIGEKIIDRITFGGVQSLRGKAWLLGKVDLLIVDECDEINHKDEGVYRKLINDLLKENPTMRVIGLTATPYRTGHGLITDKPALFDALLEPVNILELQAKGYLTQLISKHTSTELDIKGVSIRGGDYVESELQKAVDKELTNQAAVLECIKRGENRKSWLLFCAGIEHAAHVAECLTKQGIKAAYVTGDTPKLEREKILADFKAGRIRAVTNANVLTVGFDHPGIDLIAFLRPTCSQRLYVQMAGRGLRIAPGKDNCIVLDFAGNVARHGPITAIRLPKKAGEGGGVAPSKLCPECDEILPTQTKKCPACGYDFPKVEKEYKLHDDDIMGRDLIKDFEVSGWGWEVQTSKKSQKPMLVCSYYAKDLASEPIKEYFCVYHEGYAGYKAMAKLKTLCKESGIKAIPEDITMLKNSPSPIALKYKANGNFREVISREWEPLPF